MNQHYMEEEMIQDFKQHLIEEERSEATILKYLHDVSYFFTVLNEQTFTKQAVLNYKEELTKTYAITSANSMLAAVNSFFRFMGWNDCIVKQFKVQKKVFCQESKELNKQEYYRLLTAARKNKNMRLYLVLQVICATGIRASELQYITVEALENSSVEVTCKGKTRTIFLPNKLRKLLKKYIKEQGIMTGAIFITKNRKPIHRSNIWREMKKLCKEAGVSESKVFPHNLRHLFARTFYKMEKDIAKLADILGHSSIDTTRIYIISTGAEHSRQMDRMQLVI